MEGRVSELKCRFCGRLFGRHHKWCVVLQKPIHFKIWNDDRLD
jgi:hypothetical protein